MLFLKHVLCVEDNAIDRLAIERMVKSKGLPYEIEVAVTIAEARNLFMGNPGRRGYAELTLLQDMKAEG